MIESRIKLECEREQQEQLLLSVIPAYIAAEVSYKKSRDIMRNPIRNRDCGALCKTIAMKILLRARAYPRNRLVLLCNH